MVENLKAHLRAGVGTEKGLFLNLCVLIKFKVGNVKICTSIAGIVEKSSREIRKKSEKIFGGLNKMNCLREAFEELKLFVWKSN